MQPKHQNVSKRRVGYFTRKHQPYISGRPSKKIPYKLHIRKNSPTFYDMKLEYDVDFSFSAQELELIFALESRQSGKKIP
jgi:hypothetical protein